VPAVLGPYNLVDIGTGVMTAFATALGVYHRLVTGSGQHVQASLAQTATYHQAAYLLDYRGVVSDEPRGWEALGSGPLQRFYRAADGWLFLGARREDSARLAGVEGLESAAGLDGPALERVLEARLAGLPAAEWVDRLRRAGFGAHAWVSLAELMTDPAVRAQGLSVSQVSEEAGDVTMPGLSVALSATPMRVGAPARRPGADAEPVLQDIGLAGSLGSLERAWVLQVVNAPPGW
jgi:crotonobetainyl-CoA:carnitine CoA-transferase CaiB-like acyl-CoA transferase